VQDPNVAELKAKYEGHEFDESRFVMNPESMAAFAKACGETQPRFVDPSDDDFQAVPSYPTRFHGRRALPDDFPMEIIRSFDGGKCVEPKHPIRAGQTLVARSHIHDIFEKTGRSGGMMFVVHRMEFYDEDDRLMSIVDWKLIQKHQGQKSQEEPGAKESK